MLRSDWRSQDAFAEAIIWGFDVAAASGSTTLVDATSFVVRDGPRHSSAAT